MEDLLNICDTVLTYIKDRKEKIETDIAGVDEKIKVNEDDADANNYDYNHLSLLQRATGRSPSLLRSSDDNERSLYVAYPTCCL